MNNKNVYIVDSNCITPLGFDVDSNFESLSNGISGIQYFDDSKLLEIPFFSSIIDSQKLDDAFNLIEKDNSFSRSEKMMILALKPLVDKHKINPNTAFILSTTKGNITSLENENNPIQNAQLSSLAKKVASYFGFQSEPIVLSNACVSGVLAIAIAKRMIEANAFQEAYVVGVDEVSKFVLSGFNSFQALSEEACKPYDKNRSGVTLGEAAAASFVTSDMNKVKKGDVKIIGDGAINDANHISGPSRTGEGLYKSIKSALDEATISSQQIDFISAHGTATFYNDEMEAIAFNRLDLQNVSVNSFKGFFGHTLGASGLLETVISIESAKKNTLIASKGFEEIGVTQPINVIEKTIPKEINYFLKTASGFGGCNTAVLFEKVK